MRSFFRSTPPKKLMKSLIWVTLFVQKLRNLPSRKELTVQCAAFNSGAENFHVCASQNSLKPATRNTQQSHLDLNSMSRMKLTCLYESQHGNSAVLNYGRNPFPDVLCDIFYRVSRKCFCWSHNLKRSTVFTVYILHGQSTWACIVKYNAPQLLLCAALDGFMRMNLFYFWRYTAVKVSQNDIVLSTEPHLL